MEQHEQKKIFSLLTLIFVLLLLYPLGVMVSFLGVKEMIESGIAVDALILTFMLGISPIIIGTYVLVDYFRRDKVVDTKKAYQKLIFYFLVTWFLVAIIILLRKILG